MVHQSSILVYLIASGILTQALPLGETTSNNDIYKRHNDPTPPQLVPAGKHLPPDQQTTLCVFNYVLENAEKDDKEQLDYKDLIDGCKEAVSASTNAVASAVLLPGPALLPTPPSPDSHRPVWLNSPTAPPLTDEHDTPTSADANPKPSKHDSKNKGKSDASNGDASATKD